MNTDAVPGLEFEQKVGALAGLQEFLELTGIPSETGTLLEGEPVPLVIRLPSGDICVEVHHPLLDPAASPSRMVLAALLPRVDFFLALEPKAVTIADQTCSEPRHHIRRTLEEAIRTRYRVGK